MESKLIHKLHDISEKHDIVILEGMSGAGKSTLLHNFYVHHKKSTSHVHYFTIQQEQWSRKWRNANIFVERLLAKKKEANKPLHLFIDDIHLIPHPLTFLSNVTKLLHKKQREVHITATTGIRLSPKEHSQLPSEKSSIHKTVFFQIYGKSVRDIVFSLPDAPNIEEPIDINDRERLIELHDWISQKNVRKTIDTFIEFGGLEIDLIKTTGKQKRIKALKAHRNHHFHSVIAPTSSKSRSYKTFTVAEILSNKSSQFLKEKDVAEQAHYPIHKTKKVLNLLTKSFMFYYVSPFFTDTRYETAKRNVVYATDPGIPLSFQHKGDPNIMTEEQAIRTFVFTEFLKRYVYTDIFYYRTVVGKYIPYILRRGKSLAAIGIALGEDSASQLSILKSFSRKYKKHTKRSVLITKDTLDFDQDIPRIPYYLAPFVCFLPEKK